MASASSLGSSVPRDAEWLSPTEVAIIWDDGHRSVYTTAYLRAFCPCAVCRAQQIRESGGADLLTPLPTEQALASPQVEAVGRYAIRLHWGDGHDSGIYAFDYLRAICPCDDCAGSPGHEPGAAAR